MNGKEHDENVCTGISTQCSTNGLTQTQTRNFNGLPSLFSAINIDLDYISSGILDHSHLKEEQLKKAKY